jgi:hypothetical protein
MAVSASRWSRPVASHTGVSFRRGYAFDVNPVVWTLLRDRGIAVRGPAAHGVDPEPDRLRAWNVANLDGYWRQWALKAVAGRVPVTGPLGRFKSGSVLATGVLGPVRLHRTIATGEIISKEAAGQYALDTFDRRWSPLIRAALAYRLGDPVPEVADRVRLTGEFALEVIAAATRL